MVKKVLVIAYIFPPIGGSGVQRTLKFVRYLPQNGWQPLVVCGDDGDANQDGYDYSLLDEIPPEAQIWRAPFRSPLALRFWVQRRWGLKKGLVENRLVPDSPDQAQPAAPVRSPVASVEQPASLPRRLLRLLALPLAPIEFPPVDAMLYWALSIVPLCRRIIAREGVDLVYTTSFPYSDHVAGYLLKRLTGKPWVADFRDPWSRNPHARNTGWRYAVDRWVEKQVLRRADRVISVTPSYTQGLRELAPGRPSGHFVTIENGYDAQDFPQAGTASAPPEDHPRIRLFHIGRTYDGMALPVLKALDSLPAEAARRFQVTFVGGIGEGEAAYLRRRGESAQTAGGAEVCVVGRIPHDQAVRMMGEADILLLLISNTAAWKGNYPGKLFEYLASGKPILLVGPEGEAADLLRATGSGLFIPADDIPTLARVLHDLSGGIQAFRQGCFHPRPEVIARYERRALTRRLAAIFDELTAP